MKRVLIHIPVGLAAIMLAALGTIFQPWLGILLGVAFIVSFGWYEWWQCSVVNDKSWKDWSGFLWGMVIAGIAMWILGMTGVLS